MIAMQQNNNFIKNILGPRPQDNSQKGFNNFQFMSVHFWDENPNGKWTLEVKSTEAHVTGRIASLLRNDDVTI